MQETQVRSLGGKDAMGWEVARNSSILAWEILWTEEILYHCTSLEVHPHLNMEHSGGCDSHLRIK